MPTETSRCQGLRSGRGRPRKTRRFNLQLRVQNVNSSPKKDALPKRVLRFYKNIRRVLKFTTEEDDFLKEGITKHRFGQWTAILRDLDFKFQDGRTADSLKKRAPMKMPLV